MDVKKKLLIIIAFISFSLMGTALAAYLANIDVQSQGGILDAPEEVIDFDIDYDILSKDLIIETITYVIDFTLTYHGSDPLYFWDLQIEIPEDAVIIDIVDANYTLEGNQIKVSNLLDINPIFNEETIVFTLAFASQDASYLPTNFSMENFTVKEVVKAKLEALLNRISSSGNIHTYEIIIINKGNADADSWRLSLTSHQKLQVKELSTNANYVQQNEVLILSGKNGEKLLSQKQIKINYKFMSNIKNWFPEIIDLLVVDEVSYE